MPKTILDYASQAHLRRSQLYEALAPLNFTRSEIDRLILAGVIKQKHFLHRVRNRKRKPGKKSLRPKNIPVPAEPGLKKGRAFYVAKDVIRDLKLDQPT